MYLKGIIANGFKSFADKLTISLDGKNTCIVGPNGSGKSNVVDAVRWVLGEQSVKSLRGEGSMSDVIFSGSKSRKALNVASVELIFDNTDHFLNVPYTEISLKRKVYRSGENEYYLNGERCRLKDINNLLMDTGMGKESFNIISQGEVDKILSHSASDRRVIFEEASGILKYRKRKEEALRKLEKTHNNMDRVNDIIHELDLQLAPLKEQREDALFYLENKKGLDHYEVALLAYDISHIHMQLEEEQKDKEKKDQELLLLSSDTSKNDAKMIENHYRLEQLEKEKQDLNERLLKVTEEVERIHGEKKLLKEQSKTTKEENELKEESRILLEQKSKIEGNLATIKEDLKLIIEDSKKKEQEQEQLNQEMNHRKSKKNMIMSLYSKNSQDLIQLKHKISQLKEQIEQGLDMPNSVRSVVKEVSLNGIHNTIGNIITTEDTYYKAFQVASFTNKNFIITTTEEDAKNAITYLKDHHLGRATFFPLNVIEAGEVDYQTLQLLKNNQDFLGVLSDFLTYNKKYENIILNQFGMILVAPSMDAAMRLSFLTHKKYRIVTLDGDVVNIGGSMAGGSFSQARSGVMLRQELTHMEEQEKKLQQEVREKERELDACNKEISLLEEKEYVLTKEKVVLKERYDTRRKEEEEFQQKQNEITKEWENISSIQNHSIGDKEQKLIEMFHEKNAEKEQIHLKWKAIEKELEALKEEIEQAQAEDKVKNSQRKILEKEVHDLEMNISLCNMKLDTMLQTLNEDYELTYEKAASDYELDIEVEEARKKVNQYRANIKQIGMVNLNAIDEYENVNTRYEFLTKQKEDLFHAENTLLEIMNEMDEVMKEEFENTFYAIQTEFRKVFKELFHGGNADLKLTNPEDMLTTGVEIVASPPGKKLTTISLLSGGEKTLTAISLLFAILNVKTVPFCLFDEVEAALDEANVAQFGEYLEHYKDKTQFLIITHKKKTMEYANTLYGITMQESGVSKLVSVKLEEHVG